MSISDLSFAFYSIFVCKILPPNPLEYIQSRGMEGVFTDFRYYNFIPVFFIVTAVKHFKCSISYER